MPKFIFMIISVVIGIFLGIYFKNELNPVLVTAGGSICFMIGYSFIFNDSGKHNKLFSKIMVLTGLVALCCSSIVITISRITLIGAFMPGWMLFLGVLCILAVWVNYEESF